MCVVDRSRAVRGCEGAMRYCIVGVYSAESRVSPPRLRIEPDCKFISGQSPPVRGCTYAQLFLLFVYFFLDETRLSPFVLKWTSCHYTPCYCYFFFDVFIEFYVERAFRLEKCSFCVRPGEFAWQRHRRGRYKMSYEISFISEFSFIVRLLK